MKCSAVAVTIYGKWMPSCQVEQRIMQTLHRHYMSHKCVLNELDVSSDWTWVYSEAGDVNTLDRWLKLTLKTETNKQQNSLF